MTTSRTATWPLLAALVSATLIPVAAGTQDDVLFVTGDKVGIGTATPATELHVATGDAPEIRLEQDGSGGQTPQTWDLAGDETGFFVRDLTGSTLPFLISAGGAPSSSLTIAADGDVGIGTSSPAAGAQVHIRQTDGTARLLVEEASGTLSNNRVLVEIVNNGRAQFRLRNTADPSGQSWFVSSETTGTFVFSRSGTGVAEVTVTPGGDLTVTGDLFSATCTAPGSPCAPDYVFDSDYALRPIDELAAFIAENKHLPSVPSAAEFEEKGRINLGQFQMTLLEKIEELTLYTLQQERTISRQERSLADLEARLSALESEGSERPAAAR
jgi:hypothetical protein